MYYCNKNNFTVNEEIFPQCSISTGCTVEAKRVDWEVVLTCVTFKIFYVLN